MLARKKNSMFVSFRKRPPNLESELRLNVRRGLTTVAAANDDNETDTKNIDGTPISGPMDSIAIDEMTSEQICNDKRAHFLPHERILKDIVYTKKWWKAICCNGHLFKDKIVLDVTCGFGMLSMFSAMAGAKHVYAIDTSNVVQLTRRIVADNGLTHKITVIKGSATEISLPVDEVDIIVSTFMGAETLLCDNHLDELIDAREKWLSPNGLIFPDRCNLFIMALDNKVHCNPSNFWQHVYTFDMSSVNAAGMSAPYFKRVNRNEIASKPCLIKRMNMYTIEKCDYRRFDTPFRLDSELKTSIGAFAIYFDVEFNEGVYPIRFTTAPGLSETQWKTMIFSLTGNDFHLNKGDRFFGVFRFDALDDDPRKSNIVWSIEVMYKSERSHFRDKWTFRTR